MRGEWACCIRQNGLPRAEVAFTTSITTLRADFRGTRDEREDKFHWYTGAQLCRASKRGKYKHDALGDLHRGQLASSREESFGGRTCVRFRGDLRCTTIVSMRSRPSSSSLTVVRLRVDLAGACNELSDGGDGGGETHHYLIDVRTRRRRFGIRIRLSLCQRKR